MDFTFEGGLFIMLKEINNNHFEMFIKKYMDLFEEVVATYYRTVFTINPEAFPMMDRKNIKFYICKTNPKHLYETNYLIYFVHSRLECPLYNFRDYTSIEELTKIGEIGENNYWYYLLEKQDNIHPKNIVHIFRVNNVFHSIIDTIESEPIQMEHMSNWLRSDIKSKLDLRLSNYQNHNNLSSGYYARNAYKYAFSDFDLEEILTKVNNEDFTYAINEAVACFDNSLYLAGCAALGVAFETACLELLKRTNVKIYGSVIKDYRNGGLGRYINELYKLEAISLKTQQRISKVCVLRNIASHASKGKIVKGDFKSMVTDLIEFIDSSFQ